MTYDARGSGGSLDKANLIFGGLVVAVAAAAFFLVFKGPELFSGGGSAPKVAQTGDDSLAAAFDDPASKAYFKALAAADADAYRDLEAWIADEPGASRAERQQIVIDHSEEFLRQNAKLLARADAKHVDAMLALGRKGLKQAQRSGSKFCRGAFYASLEGRDPAEIERIMQDAFSIDGAAYQFGVEFNTLIAEAVIDARANPVRHGSINRQDETAMQGVVMSLMGDPQIMSLMMAGNGTADPKTLLRKLDVCELGDTLLAAARTLPQDTKGRVWAEAMRTATSSNPLSSLQGLGGF